MDIIFTAVIVALVAVAIFTGKASSPEKKDNIKMENNQPPSTPSGQIATPAPTPIVPAPRPTPPIQVVSTGININDFRYPNSSVSSSSDGHLILQSSDSADAITDWYKQKIIATGANVKSFVTTKTNDNVLNSLSGATGKANISVKINKPSGEASVSIDVTISSS